MHHVVQHLQRFLLVRWLGDVDVAGDELLAAGVHDWGSGASSWHRTASSVYARDLVTPHLLFLQLHQLLLHHLILLRELHVLRAQVVFLALQPDHLILLLRGALPELYQLLRHLGHGGVLALSEAYVGLRKLVDLLDVADLAARTLRIQQVSPRILIHIELLRADHVLEYLYTITQVPVLVLEDEVVGVHLVFVTVEVLDAVPQQFVTLMQFLNHLHGLDEFLR